MLAGRDHGPVADVRPVDTPGAPPGTVELDLLEAGRAVAGGCVRGRRRAAFRHALDEPADGATFADAHRVDEAALAKGGGCADAAYAHVSPGIPVATALDALARLDRTLRSPGRVRITCRSTIDPGLCADRGATLRALAAAPVRSVLVSADAVELLIGERGQPPIAVSFDGPDGITVTKETPAPF